jgi:small subunit ribosomal protein S15
LIEKLSIHKNHLNNIGMYLNKEDKQKIFAKHGKDKNDSGTAEAQIALFTRRIEAISNHLKTNKKDHNSKKALVQLVGKRRDLLNYLVKKDITRYRNIIKELKLRK